MSEPDHGRTRDSYDRVAPSYLDEFHDELAGKPLDRALLSALVEHTDATRAIGDLGCGPGHVGAWLADRGRRVVGIDLSPTMVDVGRRRYPEVEFRQGDLLALPADDGEFGAVVVLYSIIHLEPDELEPACHEMRRVLSASGLALVSFHAGAETRHLTEWFGHEVDLDFHFWDAGAVADALGRAGLEETARLERRPYPGEAATRRCYLMARAG